MYQPTLIHIFKFKFIYSSIKVTKIVREHFVPSNYGLPSFIECRFEVGKETSDKIFYTILSVMVTLSV